MHYYPQVHASDLSIWPVVQAAAEAVPQKGTQWMLHSMGPQHLTEIWFQDLKSSLPVLSCPSMVWQETEAFKADTVHAESHNTQVGVTICLPVSRMLCLHAVGLIVSWQRCALHPD